MGSAPASSAGRQATGDLLPASRGSFCGKGGRTLEAMLEATAGPSEPGKPVLSSRPCRPCRRGHCPSHRLQKQIRPMCVTALLVCMGAASWLDGRHAGRPETRGAQAAAAMTATQAHKRPQAAHHPGYHRHRQWGRWLPRQRPTCSDPSRCGSCRSPHRCWRQGRGGQGR